MEGRSATVRKGNSSLTGQLDQGPLLFMPSDFFPGHNCKGISGSVKIGNFDKETPNFCVFDN